MKRDVMSLVIMCCVLICMVLFSVFAKSFSAILFILISGVVGLAVHYLGALASKRKGDREQ